MFVTGAAGLIGGAVAQLLLARGHRVIGCDDFSVGTARCENERLEWVSLDVAAPDAGERLARYSPAVVVHCAAHPGGRSNQEPSADVRVNALGSMQVFEWCARSGIPVVYLSSSIVYGDQPPEPTRESAPLHPGTVYAACKVACENFLRVLGATYGLQWTVLRLFATYGPGHRPSATQGLLNVMLTQLLDGDRVVVRGSLDRVRDLLYVDDAAEAIATCLFDARTRGATFNVGTGIETTVRSVLTELSAALGRDERRLVIEEAAATPGDPDYNVADISLFNSVTGWTPRVTLAEGTTRLVAARRGLAAAE